MNVTDEQLVTHFFGWDEYHNPELPNLTLYRDRYTQVFTVVSNGEMCKLFTPTGDMIGPSHIIKLYAQNVLKNLVGQLAQDN